MPWTVAASPEVSTAPSGEPLDGFDGRGFLGLSGSGGIEGDPRRPSVRRELGTLRFGDARPPAASILAGETAANFIIQTGDQLEAGVKGTFLGGKVTAALSWFDIALSNFQVPNSAFNTDPTQPQFLFQDLTSKGWEIEFSAMVTPEFLIIGHATQLKTRDPYGVRQRMVADTGAALFGRYEFKQGALKKFSVTFGLDNMGEAPGEQASGLTAASTAGRPIPNQPSFYLAPRTLYSLGFGYTKDHRQARLKIDNRFDKDYLQSAGSRNTLVAGLPRTWSVSVGYKF